VDAFTASVQPHPNGGQRGRARASALHLARDSAVTRGDASCDWRR